MAIVFYFFHFKRSKYKSFFINEKFSKITANLHKKKPIKCVQKIIQITSIKNQFQKKTNFNEQKNKTEKYINR